MSSTSSVTTSGSILYAPPQVVLDPCECEFYHCIDLPEFGTTQGQWDLRGRVDEYLGQIEISGQRVLDVGTASGFLTFEMERQGASVVSFDADSHTRLQPLPFKGSWVKPIGAEGLTRLKNSYWFAHRLLQSNAQAYYGNIYDMPEALGLFDVVVVAQILVHLRDPIGALASIVDRVAPGGKLVIAEGMVHSDQPYAHFLQNAASRDISPVWWQLSTGLYREVLSMMGFTISQQSYGQYRCVAIDNEVGITTLLCERRD